MSNLKKYSSRWWYKRFEAHEFMKELYKRNNLVYLNRIDFFISKIFLIKTFKTLMNFFLYISFYFFLLFSMYLLLHFSCNKFFFRGQKINLGYLAFFGIFIFGNLVFKVSIIKFKIKFCYLIYRIYFFL